MSVTPARALRIKMQREAGRLQKAAVENESYGDKRGGKLLRKRARKLVDESMKYKG